MERTPRFRSSPIAMISRITMGERESAFSTRSWPRSMRLAISTSPSRVSSGHGAHLAQIHADGIVGLLQRARREVQFHVLAGFDFVELLVAPHLRAFEHINALRADGGQQVLEVVGRMHVVRDQVVHLVVGEIALLFTHIDQFFDIVVLVFKSQSGISSIATP